LFSFASRLGAKETEGEGELDTISLHIFSSRRPLWYTFLNNECLQAITDNDVVDDDDDVEFRYGDLCNIVYLLFAVYFKCAAP